jgi:transposase
VKVVWWDANGFALYYMRLERGTFVFPDFIDGGQAINHHKHGRGRLPDHLPLYRLEDVFSRQGGRSAAPRCVPGCWPPVNCSSRWWS